MFINIGCLCYLMSVEDKIQYVVSSQEFLEEGRVHSGGLVEAKCDGLVVGSVGYIDWNVGFYNNGLETARLKREGTLFGIKVDAKNHRGRGIGESLFAKLFDELSQDGVEQLVLFSVIGSAKGFYDNIFPKFMNSGVLKDFYVRERKLHDDETQYVYDLRLDV